jgi:uncharacterized repeat protein (TIGR01451 family)
MSHSRRVAWHATVLFVLVAGASTAAATPPPDKGTGSAVDVVLTAPDSAVVGEQFEYVATISAGKSPMEDVQLTDPLPSPLRYIGASSDHGSCSEFSGTVTCAIGSLARRESAVVKIQVVADAAATITNRVDVTAQVSGKQSVGSASATTAVSEPPPPDPALLRVEYSRDAGPALVGAALTYRAKVTNDGSELPLSFVFGAYDNWSLGYHVIESFTSSQGTCMNSPSISFDVFGIPISHRLADAPRCDVGPVGTGQVVELVAVVRTTHPTTEQLPLYTVLGAATGGSASQLLVQHETVVTTGAAVTDCWLTGTGHYTNVPAYVDCATGR